MKKPQLSPSFPDNFYRVTVKGLCVRDGKVLLVHDFSGRNDTDPRPEWELPGGGVDFGENFIDALKREVKEEMGLTVFWIDERPLYAWSVKRVSSRGMEWYYVATITYRLDFVDLNFTPSDECREIRFFSKEELRANYDDLGLQIRPLVDSFDPGKLES